MWVRVWFYVMSMLLLDNIMNTILLKFCLFITILRLETTFLYSRCILAPSSFLSILMFLTNQKRKKKKTFHNIVTQIITLQLKYNGKINHIIYNINLIYQWGRDIRYASYFNLYTDNHVFDIIFYLMRLKWHVHSHPQMVTWNSVLKIEPDSSTVYP